MRKTMAFTPRGNEDVKQVAGAPRGRGVQERYGRSTRRTMWLAASGALTAALALVLYLAVMALAVFVVPVVLVLVVSQMGMPLEEMALDVAVVYWMAPSLFMVIILAALALWGLRAAWGWRGRKVAAMRVYFLGEDVVADDAPRAVSAGRKAVRSGKDTKSLKNEEKNR